MTWEWAILAVYFVTLLFIFLFSLTQFNLTLNYLFKRKGFFSKTVSPALLADDKLPFVTIQLPLYNEKYVVERLIDCIAQFNYPKDRFEVQVLDDSNDETTHLVQGKVDEYCRLGIDVQLIRRDDRTGYKAGALKYGLSLAKGEYVAIFDADFLPKKDFLRNMIPYMVADPGLGVVQSRWGHINKNYSILTRIQAFVLDAHFIIEQIGRNSASHFINFNGTGGVWRKQCILDAGNWESDTLTEDLDLSYRAQMKGWRFRYFNEVESPAELPATMGALKSQQHRWTKGAAETAVKHLAGLWKSDVKFSTKFHGTMHLLNSSIFVAIIISSILSFPVLIIKYNYALETQEIFTVATWFFMSLLTLVFYYAVSFFKIEGFSFKKFMKFVLMFPLFFAVSLGMSLHNALAVFEGYLGKKTPFVRTPKFNLTTETSDGNWKKSIYRIKKVNPLTWVEGLLAIYFLVAFGYGIYRKEFELLFMHGMIGLGYFAVFVYSFKHASK